MTSKIPTIFAGRIWFASGSSIGVGVLRVVSLVGFAAMHSLAQPGFGQLEIAGAAPMLLPSSSISRTAWL